MPSSTRSSTSAIRFPSSKQAVTPTTKSTSTASKPDAITLLFRREVQSLLSTPPALPSHVPADTPVEVVACVERLSLSGIQQSVQLCQAGGETWVTRTEGGRQYFPRAGRVQKRLRGPEEDHEETQDVEDGEDLARERREAPSGDATVRRKKSKRSDARSQLETPANRASSSSQSSSSRRRTALAPKKKKKHDHRHRHRSDASQEVSDREDSDDAASTETERSHLARTRGGHRVATLTSIGEEDAYEPAQLGRGQRRCAGRNTTPQHAKTPVSELNGIQVKREESDDVASLCGRVGGLEFRSTVDPESEYEATPGPSIVASTSLDKGKARA
ncbi:hypothetical protein JCM3766R1_002049 [Sporobolomyces carnicolor]